MRKLLNLLPVLLIVACGPQSSNDEVQSLMNERDSLQALSQEIQVKINNLNKEISLVDTSKTEDELKLIKQIALQKNKVVKMSKKLKALENELASMHKEQKLVPVAIKEIKGEPFQNYITVFGRVEAVNYAEVAPEIGGQIRDIHVNAGDRVSKGQLLVSLNTDAIHNSIKATQSSLDLATITYEKQKALYDQKIGSEIQYLTAKSTKETLESQLAAQKAQLRMSQIRAPFDGIVDQINQKKGALASPMFPVLTMVNLDHLQIKADVSERYVGQINKGQVVELGFANVEGYNPMRPIVRVSKVINQASRTFEIEVRLDNADGKVKPNMVASIKVNDFNRENAVVVPSNVIRKDNQNGDYVYVVVEENDKLVVKKRNVTTSPYSYKNNTLIESGLEMGDKVVVEGYHLISSGVTVKIEDKPV